VVVIGSYTMVATLAVLASERLLNVADCAILKLIEKYNVITVLVCIFGLFTLLSKAFFI
jgi:hypothetical protein